MHRQFVEPLSSCAEPCSTKTSSCRCHLFAQGDTASQKLPSRINGGSLSAATSRANQESKHVRARPDKVGTIVSYIAELQAEAVAPRIWHALVVHTSPSRARACVCRPPVLTCRHELACCTLFEAVALSCASRLPVLLQSFSAPHFTLFGVQPAST